MGGFFYYDLIGENMSEEEDKIFELDIVDDVFTREREELKEELGQPTLPSILNFEPDEDDEGITLAELQTRARSNRPDIARVARNAIKDIEKAADIAGLTVEELSKLRFPTPTLIEDLGGVEVERDIKGGFDAERFKQAARASLGSPEDYGSTDFDELTSYLDEWGSDDWQKLRLGFSVEEILIEKWESDNNADWDNYLAERDELDDGDF